MTIEELFRNETNQRHGWELRNTLITRADPFDRLLPVLSLAYCLLLGIGLTATARYEPSMWSSPNLAIATASANPAAKQINSDGTHFRDHRLVVTVSYALLWPLRAPSPPATSDSPKPATRPD